MLSHISKKINEKINLTFKNNLDMLFFRLEIMPYTKDSNYLKMAISIAYLEHSEDISISNITKKIAGKYNAYSSDYKITTKDFIIGAIYYIDSK